MKEPAPRRGFRPPQAFLRMGLKSNPFNHLDHDELIARVAPRPWIVELARRPWDVLVLHGESGLGKTSAARMLEHLLVAEGQGPARYVRLPERGARWPGAEAFEGCRVLVVDSVQRIARWRRAGLRRLVAPGRRRLILCGQVDPTRGILPLERILAGRLERVTPPPPDVPELLALYARYLELARRPGAPSAPPLEQSVARELLRLAGPNRFAVHRLQYLAFERLADAGAREPRLTLETLTPRPPLPDAALPLGEGEHGEST